MHEEPDNLGRSGRELPQAAALTHGRPPTNEAGYTRYNVCDGFTDFTEFSTRRFISQIADVYTACGPARFACFPPHRPGGFCRASSRDSGPGDL